MKLNELIAIDRVLGAASNYGCAGPFDHCVVDGFFHEHVAQALSEEFPNFGSDIWHSYDNAIEIKRTCNNWNVFPPLTYAVFDLLNSKQFLDFISKSLLGGEKAYSDPGLNGGGWHIHKRGGKLNTHLDYSLHPKLGKQRKLNIIIYLNPHWQEGWGGSLGLWGNQSSEKPGDLVKQIWSKFNRAVIFDTTQNSWHGLPEPLVCPENQCRKSMAVYYLIDPPGEVDARGKALFAPTKQQENDERVLDLIKNRSSVESASSVYR